MAREAEAIGLDSLWLVDHFLWVGDPWSRDDGHDSAALQTYGVTECWTTLAAVAEATSRIRIGTMVTCTAYRNPALLAKMADTVDQISQGRLILGLGAGDYPPEHAKLGVPADQPFARFEEALAIIVPLLRTGRVDFHGKFYRASQMELKPRPPLSTGPPIMIGSLRHGPRSLRIIAQNADIWNTWLVARTSNDLPGIHQAIDAACIRYQRDPATLRRTVGVPVMLDGSEMMTWPGIVRGANEQIAETLQVIASQRIDEIQLIVFPTTPQTMETISRIVELARSA